MKTKFILLITILYLFKLSAYSQDSSASKEFKHIIKISPLAFLTKARISYEYILPGKQGKWTAGFIGTWHYDSDYKGLVIEPIVRYYLDGNARGFYFQGKATVGRVKSTVYYTNVSAYFYDSTGAFTGKYSVFIPDRYKSRSLTTLGGSLAFGYQFFLSKNKRWLMDFNIGIQYAVYLNDLNFTETTYSANGSKQIVDYSNGKIDPYFGVGSPYQYMEPNSRLTSNLFIGYRF